jgi:hypothetical protein
MGGGGCLGEGRHAHKLGRLRDGERKSTSRMLTVVSWLGYLTLEARRRGRRWPPALKRRDRRPRPARRCSCPAGPCGSGVDFTNQPLRLGRDTRVSSIAHPEIQPTHQLS